MSEIDASDYQDINLDEVEASIKRCEEFLTKNEFNIEQAQQLLQQKPTLIPKQVQVIQKPLYSTVNQSIQQQPQPAQKQQPQQQQQKKISIQQPEQSNISNKPSKKQFAISTVDPDYLKRSQHIRSMVENDSPQQIEDLYENVANSNTVQQLQGINDKKQPAINNKSISNQQISKTTASKVNTTLNNNNLNQQQQITKLSQYNQTPNLKIQRGQSQKTSKKIQELKQQQEDKRMKECTFTPQINKNSVAMAQYKKRDTYEEILQKREQHKLTQQRKEFEECTFRPQINKNSELLRAQRDDQDQKVEDRLIQQQLTKQTHQQENDQVTTEKDENYINYRNTLAERAYIKQNPDCAGLDTFTRLYKSKSINQQKREAMNEENVECVFTPKISKKSLQLAENMGDFQERQQLYRINRNNKLNEIEKNNQTQVYKQAVDSESQDETFRRLYTEKKDRDQRREIAQDADLTFQPQINQQSRLLAQNKPSIFENTIQMQRDINDHKKQTQAIYEQQQQEQCTFKPQISEYSRNAMPHYRFDQVDTLMTQIQAEREFKELKLQNERRALEYQNELQFAQKQKLGNNNIDRKIYEKVHVNGLEMFEKRQSEIKKLKNDQKERENKAFGLSNRNRTPTVCQPFNLTIQQKSVSQNVFLSTGVEKTKAGDLIDALLRAEV